MKNTDNINQNDPIAIFSYFSAPITTTVPSSTINIYELYKMITEDAHIKQICDKMRQLQDKTAMDAIKNKQLPFITTSGTFLKRSNKLLTQHSGFLCVDFDKIPEQEVSNIRKLLVNDTSIETVLLFLSPSGRGLKWIIKIPAVVETHGDYFDAVRNYLITRYGDSMEKHMDKSCRDVSRPCYLSSDENGYITDINIPDVKPLDAEFLSLWLNNITANGKTLSPERSKSEKVKQVQKLITEIKSKKIDLTSEYADWIKVGYALCELGETGRHFFHEISCFYAGYDYDETDIKYSRLLNEYNGDVKLGTLFHIAKAHEVMYNMDIRLKEHDSDSTPINRPVIISSLIPRTAQKRMEDAKNQPPIQQLLGPIWHTGELHIMFGDNGTGKSVFATQIADAITKGQNVFNVLKNENPPLKVLTYDFELSDKQFEIRYTNDDGHPHTFSENFYIDNINFYDLHQQYLGMRIDDMITCKMESDIENLKPDVLIIDNLTYLKTEAVQDANVALQIVRKLNELKTKYKLSILVIAHTPKVRGESPITNNDLAGSKQLSNLVDSISAIGKSNRNPHEKYIKQIKCRSAEMVFTYDNIITTTMTKDDTFLKFEYIDFECESEHLRETDNGQKQLEKQMKIQEVLGLYRQGLTFLEIESKTGIPHTTANRWVNKYGNDGAIAA